MTPVTIDACLYCAIALFGFFATCFSGDEAAKYIEAPTLFWVRTIFGGLSAAFLALKMFRSNTYAIHVEKLKRKVSKVKDNIKSK